MDNLVLGELGEGFPILFQLMKYLNWMIFILMFIFFIPTISLIGSALNKYGDKTTIEEKLSLYSFGALLKYMDPQNLVVFQERQDYIIGYCLVLAVSVVITFLAIQIIRKKLNNIVEVIDKLSFTPSDFCVQGYCPEFSEDCDYSIQGITDEVKSYYKENYEIDDIEYVNVAYDIENIFDLHDQERILLRKREIINWYCEKKNWQTDQYKNQMATHDIYEDFPCESEGLMGCFAKTPLDLDAIETELEQVQKQIEEVEATTDVNAENVSREDRIEKYTGKIFVVLKTDQDMDKVIDEVGDNLFVRFFKTFCTFCYDSNQLW